jgi:hypothetical protein
VCCTLLMTMQSLLQCLGLSCQPAFAFSRYLAARVGEDLCRLLRQKSLERPERLDVHKGGLLLGGWNKEKVLAVAQQQHCVVARGLTECTGGLESLYCTTNKSSHLSGTVRRLIA